MTHRYVDEWEEQFRCTSCHCEIDCDQSSNGAGRCEMCFWVLEPREQEQLRAQDELLYRTLRRLYPAGIAQAEG